MDKLAMGLVTEKTPSGTIIDTHAHAGLDKYEPIECLVDQMFRNGVAGAVLVQHRGQFNNRYLLECAERFPDRLAIICMVDVDKEDGADRLAHWASKPHVRGVRLKTSDRSPGRDPWAIWERADELRLSVSLSGRGPDYASEETAGIVGRFRNLVLVVEHLGWPSLELGVRGGEFLALLRLADLPHVYMKLSGFHLFNHHQKMPYPESMAFIRAAVDAFGPERCMWGSNHPVVSGAEGYHNALRHAREHWPWKDDRERRLVLGETAQRLYRLAPLANSGNGERGQVEKKASLR